MLRRDYIQKMIEEFARAVTHALQLNTDGKREDALRHIQQSYTTYFNDESDHIRLLQPSQLLKKLVAIDGLTPAQIEILAHGIRTEADLLLTENPEQAKDRYVKALALYEYVEHTDHGNYSIVRKHAIEEIKYSISAL